MKSHDTNRCAWFRERIDLYVDGEMTGEELESFETHLAGCETCQNELDMAGRVLGGLRALPDLACPDRVVDEAAARIDAPAPVPSPVRGRLWGWLGGRGLLTLRPALAATALVVVVAAVYVASNHGVLWHDTDTVTVKSDFTPQELEEIEAVQEGVELAFAYVGKYGCKTGIMVTNEVIEERVIGTVRKAMERDAASKHQ